MGQELPSAVQVGQRKYCRTRAVCRRDIIMTSDVCSVLGSNRLPVDRRDNGAAEDRGLDTLYREARGRVLPDPRRPLAVVGRRHEGTPKTERCAPADSESVPGGVLFEFWIRRPAARIGFEPTP